MNNTPESPVSGHLSSASDTDSCSPVTNAQLPVTNSPSPVTNSPSSGADIGKDIGKITGQVTCRVAKDGHTQLWFFNPDAWWNDPTIARVRFMAKFVQWMKDVNPPRTSDGLPSFYPWSLPPEIKSLTPEDRPGYHSGNPSFSKNPYPLSPENDELPYCLVCERPCCAVDSHSVCCGSQLVYSWGDLIWLPDRAPFSDYEVRRRKSEYRHVYPLKNGKWAAQVYLRGRTFFNGSYKTEIEAAHSADDLMFEIWMTGRLETGEPELNFPLSYKYRDLAQLRSRAYRTPLNVARFLRHIDARHRTAEVVLPPPKPWAVMPDALPKAGLPSKGR